VKEIVVEHWTLSQTVNFNFYDKLPINFEMNIVTSVILEPGYTNRKFNYLNYNSLHCNDKLYNPEEVTFSHGFYNLDHSVDRKVLESN